MNDQKPTVLIVDDDPKALEALRHLLEINDYRVETFSSSSALLNSPIEDGVPYCAIVSAQMPRITGLQLQPRLVKKRPGLPLIFLSDDGDISKAVCAMRAGATDFLVKPIEEQKLLDVVKRAFVLEKRIRLEREERVNCRNRFDSLTLREKEVCAFVAQGKLNKQIAAELGICEKTVKVHRGRVMKKMGVESVAELVRVVVKLDTLPATFKGQWRGDRKVAANLTAVANRRAAGW
jgi:FixJ family two-component response regulator